MEHRRPVNTPTRLLAGTVIIIGGLWLGYAQTKGAGAITHSIETAQGVYLGIHGSPKGRMLSLLTEQGQLELRLDPSIRVLKHPPLLGAGVTVTYSAADPHMPTIWREADIATTPTALAVLLPKDNPMGPWIIEGQWARNGETRYRTDLPDGEYDSLRGLVAGRDTRAVL